MAAYLQTIRETLQELNPAEYQNLAQSGELEPMLQEFSQQVQSARSDASRGARKEAEARGDTDPTEIAALMHRAARSAQEIALSLIVEDLTSQYGQTTELPTEMV